MNNNKYTLIINNVKDNGMAEYLEKLCHEEHVKIKTAYQDGYSWIHNTYETNSLFSTSKSEGEYVLESNSHERLCFIKYLYDLRLNTKKIIKNACIQIKNRKKSKYIAMDALEYYANKDGLRDKTELEQKYDSTEPMYEAGVFRTNFPTRLGGYYMYGVDQITDKEHIEMNIRGYDSFAKWANIGPTKIDEHDNGCVHITLNKPTFKQNARKWFIKYYSKIHCFLIICIAILCSYKVLLIK